MVEVWATDFDAGSFDACSSPIKLSFDEAATQFNAIYTCENLGSHSVNLWAHDAAGNSAFCTTFINVQANDEEDCDPIEVEGLVAGLIQNGRRRRSTRC